MYNVWFYTGLARVDVVPHDGVDADRGEQARVVLVTWPHRGKAGPVENGLSSIPAFHRAVEVVLDNQS